MNKDLYYMLNRKKERQFTEEEKQAMRKYIEENWKYNKYKWEKSRKMKKLMSKL